MREIGRYDTEMQQFVEAPKVANMNHLRFLRKLAEKGVFGPKPVSVPKGENVFRLRQNELTTYAMQQGDQELQTPDQKMRQHMAANGDY